MHVRVHCKSFAGTGNNKRAGDKKKDIITFYTGYTYLGTIFRFLPFNASHEIFCVVRLFRASCTVSRFSHDVRASSPNV